MKDINFIYMAETLVMGNAFEDLSIPRQLFSEKKKSGFFKDV